MEQNINLTNLIDSGTHILNCQKPSNIDYGDCVSFLRKYIVSGLDNPNLKIIYSNIIENKKFPRDKKIVDINFVASIINTSVGGKISKFSEYNFKVIYDKIYKVNKYYLPSNLLFSVWNLIHENNRHAFVNILMDCNYEIRDVTEFYILEKNGFINVIISYIEKQNKYIFDVNILKYVIYLFEKKKLSDISNVFSVMSIRTTLSSLCYINLYEELKNTSYHVKNDDSVNILGRKETMGKENANNDDYVSWEKKNIDIDNVVYNFFCENKTIGIYLFDDDYYRDTMTIGLCIKIMFKGIHDGDFKINDIIYFDIYKRIKMIDILVQIDYFKDSIDILNRLIFTIPIGKCMSELPKIYTNCIEKNYQLTEQNICQLVDNGFENIIEIIVDKKKVPTLKNETKKLIMDIILKGCSMWGTDDERKINSSKIFTLLFTRSPNINYTFTVHDLERACFHRNSKMIVEILNNKIIPTKSIYDLVLNVYSKNELNHINTPQYIINLFVSCGYVLTYDDIINAARRKIVLQSCVYTENFIPDDEFYQYCDDQHYMPVYNDNMYKDMSWVKYMCRKKTMTNTTINKMICILSVNKDKIDYNIIKYLPQEILQKLVTMNII